MKRKLCAAVCACLLLTGCSRAKAQETELAPQTTQVETTENSNIKIFEEAKTEIEDRLSSNEFFSYVNVNYDDENFTVSVATPGMWEVVSEALNSGIKSSAEQWQSVRDSTLTGYDLVKKILEEAGADLENVKVSFDLVNDEDTESVIVSTVDGSVFYDIIEAMGKMADAGILETNPEKNDDLSESDKELIHLVESTATDSFNNFSVDIKDGIVYVSYSYPNLTNVESGLKSGGESLLTIWNNLVDVTQSLGEGIGELVKAYGSDYSTNVSLVDDSDTSKYLVIVIDGVITYNIADNL
nr:MAG TPA: Protein involved in gliding motility 9 Secretion System Type.5A [Caudoviricetes sp.]